MIYHQPDPDVPYPDIIPDPWDPDDEGEFVYFRICN